MAEKTVSVRLAARVDQYVAAMRAASASTTGFAAATERNLTRVGSQMQNVGRMATIGVSLPIVAAAGFAVKAAVDWESAWAGVTKTVDGTVQEMGVLEQGLRDMTKEVSASHGEIAAVAEAAGALGVAQEDILDFTRVMVDLGETTDLTSDQAATAIAQMMNVMQTAPGDVDNLGAALVHLGNNGASTESQILDMATRIAGAGEIVGLSEAEVLGFASALASMGIEAEAGGSAFSRVISDISKAVSQGGDDLDTFASVAGVSASAFATAFREDPAAAIVSFVDGLGRIHASGGDVFTVLDELGLADVRVSRALLSMATSGDLLTTSLDDGAQAWSDNTALAEEAAKRYDTAGARFEMVRNQIVDLFIDLGEIMLPVVEAVVGAIGDLAETFQALPQPVQIAVGGFLALVAAMGPMMFVGGMVVKNLTSITSVLSKIGTPMSMAAKAFGALGVAATLGVVGYQLLTTEQRRTEQNTRAATAALDTQFDSLMVAAIAAAGAAGEVDALAIANEALSRSIAEGNDALADSAAQLNIGASEILDVFALMDADGQELITTVDFLARSFGLSAEQADFFARNYAVLGSSFSDPVIVNSIREQGEEIGITAEQFDTLTDATMSFFQAADDQTVQQIARDFLNARVEAEGLEGSLVGAAEAQAETNRQTGDAVAVYRAYAEIVATASDEELAAAGITDEMAAAVAGLTPELDAATGAMGELEAVAASSIDTMSNYQFWAEDVAHILGEYTSAIDDAVNPHRNLMNAIEGVWAAADTFGDKVNDNEGDLDLLTQGINEQTEAGRENRDLIQGWADEIIDLAKARLEDGESIETVNRDYAHNRDAILDAAEAAGLNRDAVDEMLTKYGAVPELITTSIEIANDALAAWRIERHLEKLDEIDPVIATALEVAIDNEDWATANQILRDLETPLDVPVRINVTETRLVVHSNGRDFNVGSVRGSMDAAGAYVPGGSMRWGTTGEISGRRGDEVILPLGDPGRMAALLGMSEVGPRVAAAFGNLMPVPQTAFAPVPPAPTSASRGGDINTGDIHVGSRQDLPDLYNELGRVQFLSQFAGSRG